jgi:plasmid stabilization system protein ParE
LRIGDANPFAVRRFRARVQSAIKRLSRFPSSGNFVHEYPALRLREFVVEPYRFFYFIDNMASCVRIVAVWHGAQLPAQPDLAAP